MITQPFILRSETSNNRNVFRDASTSSSQPVKRIAAMHRFYLPNFQQPALSAQEAHHATHVLRVKDGETVNVFDGRGHEAQAQVVNIAGQSVGLKLLTQTGSAPLPCRITLAQAIPKRNMDLIVQKATELGVAVIVPLISERTVVQILPRKSQTLLRPVIWSAAA